MCCRAAAFILALMAFSAEPAIAAQGNITCNLSAFVADPDPNGMNVRAAPSTRARVLQVIPNNSSGVAAVREQRGTWFRVTVITDAETDATLFRGEGWVHSSLLGLEVATNDPRLYGAPDLGSRLVATLIPAETPVTLIGCSGRWAKVSAANRIGWLSPAGQCSNPLTTCS